MSLDLRMCNNADIERIGDRVRHELKAQLLLRQIDRPEFCRLADNWLESVRVWVNARDRMVGGGYLDGLS